MAKSIVLTTQQLRQLLTRFQRELDSRGGSMPDADLNAVADRLVDELSPSCQVTGAEPQRMLNSNVVIKG
jgi:hypothetical protein